MIKPNLLRRSLTALLCAGTAFASGVAAAQGSNTSKVAQRADSAAAKPAQGADSTVTTLSGVFQASQAAKGREVYLLACVSCHSPADHTGGGFWKDLLGKSVAQFFSYLRNNMPQDNAGSISEDDYVNVTAYILSLNGMPAGEQPLMRDSTAQARIRITPLVPKDTTRTGRGK